MSSVRPSGNEGDLPVEPAHFTLAESGEFEPTRFAGSHWGDDHLNGPAVVGLAARTLELHHGSPDFMPTRLTVDLFRAARSVSTAVTFFTGDCPGTSDSEEKPLPEGTRPPALCTMVVQFTRSLLVWS